jgi:lipid A 3-O-deacylase
LKLSPLALLAAIPAIFAATPAQADEIFGGIYVHDVDTPLTLSGVEGGADIMLGWRGEPLTKLRLQQYFFFAANTAGETHYAAFGFSRKFGDKYFIRPGVGLAVHTGSSSNFEDPDNGKVDFGSRVLFEPEFAVGARINDRMTVEASWVHMSTAQLFGKQNPGIDNFGVRLSFKL